MKRRAFIAAGITLLAAPLAGAGQLPSIGYLSNSSGDSAPDRAFMDGLRDFGYIQGKNIAIEKRFSAGRSEQFPVFVADLLRLKVDVVAAWGPPAVSAAKRATSTIPIVGISMGDPVAQGWVASLARPGGNVTGTANLQTELSGKRIELVKEVIASVIRVAILANPGSPGTAEPLNATKIAAQSRGIQLEEFNVSEPQGFQNAFAEASRRRADALIVLPDGMFWGQRAEIVRLASQSRLPALYWSREYVDAGGLMSYAASLTDQGRRAAYFIDKILNGAKPADLPIEQPTKFELVINLKTAKALGLTIPPSLLGRADEIIQ